VEGTHPENAEVLEAVDRCYREARWQEAYALLREALAAEGDELRAAHLRVALVHGLNYEDFKRGLTHREEKHRLLDEVEAAIDGRDDGLLGSALYERGMALHIEFVMAEGDLDRELDSFTRAATLLERAGDLEGAAMATAMMGVFHHVDRLDRETADPILLRAHAMAPRDRPSLARAEAARHLGQIRQELGDPVAGLRYLEESLQIREDAGWPLHLPSAHHVIGYAKLEAGDFDGARLHLDKAIELAEQLDAPLTVAMAKRNRADLDFALLAPGVWRRSHP